MKTPQSLAHKGFLQKIHIETHQHWRANLSIRFSRPDRRIRAAASPAAEISETLIHKITVRFIAMMKRIPAGRHNCWIKKINEMRQIIIAHFNAIIKCFVEDTPSFTNYILTSCKKSSLETAGSVPVIQDIIRSDYTRCRPNNWNLYRSTMDSLSTHPLNIFNKHQKIIGVCNPIINSSHLPRSGEKHSTRPTACSVDIMSAIRYLKKKKNYNL